MTELLCAQNLNFCYGNQRVLEDICFSVREGEYLSVIGENGSGKTTLLHLLCGYLQPQSGQIFYKGENLAKIPPLRRARHIAVIGQNTPSDFSFTCLEFVLLGLYPHVSRFERIDEKSLAEIKSIMIKTDILPLAEKPITQLSGGEYQRVLLARALAQRPRLLLLDEAMSDFDAAVKIKMNKLLKQLVREGLTVVSVNHDLSAAYGFSDRIIALQNGRIAALGTVQQVFSEAFLETVFGIKAQIIPQKGLCVYDTI